MPQTIVPLDFACPTGTVHVVEDRAERMVRIFAEQSIDYLDWLILWTILHFLGIADPVFRWVSDDNCGVTVWEISLPACL